MEMKPVSIGVRVPPELAEWLKRQATENHRSLSSQVAWTLSQQWKQQELAH